MEQQKEMKELLWGISTNGDIPKWDEVWEEVTENDEEIMFQTIETFKHEDECEFGDFTFEYKYVMRISVIEDENEDGEEVLFCHTGLYLVPLAPYIHEGIIESWKSSFAEWDINDVDTSFIVREEQCPLLKRDSCELGSDIDTTWYNEDFEEFLSKAGACIQMIDRLRGFELDKPENMLGTTGWELLKGLIYNENPYELTMKRWEQHEKEQNNKEEN